MTMEEVFTKYNKSKNFSFGDFTKTTLHGGHNQWIVKYPKVNTVIRQLRDALDDGVIDYNWITDHFGGDLSSYATGITQEEASQLGKIQTISWETFISTREADYSTFLAGSEHLNYSDEKLEEMSNKVMFKGDWDNYRKPQAIDYMTAKDLKAHKLDMTDGVWSLDGERVVMKEDGGSGAIVEVREFLLTQASFRTISKTQFNIFTAADDNFNGGIFARNGKLKSNDPKEVGEFVFQLSYNENDFKKDTDAIKKLWEWRTKRNEKRSILEEKFGYDTKHLSHTIRLLIGGQNILRDGNYHPRLSGDNLVLVRNVLAGKYTYEEVVDMAEKMEKDLEPLYETSTLPHSADRVKANELLLKLSKF